MCLPMIPCGPESVVMKPIFSRCCCALAGAANASVAAATAAATKCNALIKGSSSRNIVQSKPRLMQSSEAAALGQGSRSVRSIEANAELADERQPALARGVEEGRELLRCVGDDLEAQPAQLRAHLRIAHRALHPGG